MEKSKKSKKKNLKIMFFVLYLVFCGGLGFLLGKMHNDFIVTIFNKVTIIQVIISLVISFFLNINIHEFGHFVFGKLLGYRLVMYIIGIFKWTNENGQMKFSIAKTKGYGGLCGMAPTKEESKKDIIFYLGGIIFNSLFGVISLIILIFACNIPQFLLVFLAVNFTIALLLAITNLVPFSSAGAFTDGKIVFSLLRKNNIADKLLVTKKCQMQLCSGIRPREIDIYIGNYEKIDLFEVILLYLKYLSDIDKREFDNAKKYLDILEKNLEDIILTHQSGICSEICYIACLDKIKNVRKN